MNTPQADSDNAFLQLHDLSDVNSPVTRSGSVQNLLNDMDKGIPSTVMRHHRTPYSIKNTSISPPVLSPDPDRRSSIATDDIVSRLDHIETLLQAIMERTPFSPPICPNCASPVFQTLHNKTLTHSHSSPFSHTNTLNTAAEASSLNTFYNTDKRLELLTNRTEALKRKLSDLNAGKTHSYTPSFNNKLSELERRVEALEGLNS
ncbi:hypothetical protein RCL1_007269 [Eukaryota sp. TZLM3-RCL]